MTKFFATLYIGAALFLASCGGHTGTPSGSITDNAKALAGPNANAFTDTIEGKISHLYEIQNAHIRAYITDYGGRVVSLFVPDSAGAETDVVAGFDSVSGYRRARDSYFGALIGRYGNRIGKGKFTVDGKLYSIPTNNGANALHGGTKGFSDYVWDAHKTSDSSLELNFTSKDGDMGFPGNLQVKVTYTVTGDKGLKIEYTATTDKATVVNLTNHAYFNLNGAGSGTILDHQLQIFGKGYTPVDTGLIPLGPIAPVAGTPFDFTQPTAIGARINADDVQLKNGKGYDHNFVIGDGKPTDSLRHVATVWADKTGIVLNVYSQEPGLQFYTGNFMAGRHAMKYEKRDDYRTAFCLETQHFPDSPNEPAYPSTQLEPGKTYHTMSIYFFSTKP